MKMGQAFSLAIIESTQSIRKTILIKTNKNQNSYEPNK